MAATNFTPIQLYHSTTASAAPVAGNLANGELAINITDGKLFYKDNGGTVQVLATKGTGTIGGSNTQVQYNSSGALAGSANFTFNGTTATINTLNLTNALGTTYGGTGLNSYTTGDIVYASASNTLSKLTIGTNGYILTSNGSIPTWTAGSSISVNTADNLSGGAAGSVPYQSGPGATTFLSIGAANRVLTSSGTAPQWVTSLTGLTGVSSSGLTNTSLTSGRVVYSTTGGAQTDSASLTFNGTTLTAGGFATGGSSTLDKLVKIGDSAFNLPAVLSATAPAKLYVSTATVTDASSAGGATNSLGAISSFGSTTVAASNTGVTYTNLATLYIAGAPTAGTNVTITNPYSLYIAAGAAYFGGGLTFAGQLNVTNTTDASSTSTGSIVTAGGVGIAKSLWVGLDANIYGLTVGRGGGAVSTNTAVGAGAMAGTNTGGGNVGVGISALAANTGGDNNTAVGNSALAANTNAQYNTAIGSATLLVNTTGANNTAIGRAALISNTTASNNVAVGFQAGNSNTTGTNLVAIGVQAGYGNTTANNNISIGYQAQQVTTTGANNVAIGTIALALNTTGASNIAVGTQALYSNTTASNNTAVGYQAGYSNTTGDLFTAVGYQAGYANTTGQANTAVGNQAGRNTSTGSSNTSFGYTALLSNTTGSNNTAYGSRSLFNLNPGAVNSYNTAVGTDSMFTSTTATNNVAVGSDTLYYNTTGGYNVAAGVSALVNTTTGNGNVAIGYQAGYYNTTGILNVFIGRQAGRANTVGQGSVLIGYQAGYNLNDTASSSTDNTFVGSYAGYNVTTGSKNTFIGGSIQNGGAGYLMTTGSKNTILGGYNGNQDGLDIRTSSNIIVLSDGDGNANFLVRRNSFGGYFFSGPTKTDPSGGNYYSTISSQDSDVQLILQRVGDAGAGWGGIGASSTAAFLVYGQGLLSTPFRVNQTNGTVILSGANQSATGTGITFPSSQVASSDANTLDDYEEGTWTPTLRGSSTAGSYTLNVTNANYVKIGRQVTVNCSVNVTAVGSSGTGYAQITGMPFANSGQSTGAVYFANVDLDASCMWCVVEFISDSGQTIVYFDTIRDNNSSLDTQISGFTTNSYIRFTITYNTST